MQLRNAIFVLALGSLLLWSSGVTYGQQQTPQYQTQNQNQDQKQDQKQDADTKQQKNGKPSPDEANPFPEAASQKAADAAAGTNSGSAAHSSSSHVDMKKFEAPAGRESRISNGAGGYIHDPKLAEQDDRVGKFYLQSGDFKGAYDRYKEATEVAPENADAVFGLAESARGLHRTQDAINNYTVYLDAFPDGKKSKQARKALAELSAEKKK